jgi:hypothetical protein
MQVDLTAPADNFDADAFTRGVERMLEIIPRNDDVRLDVTTDLRASVRAKHPNREYAATYESDREMATAMGKTLAQDDGSVDVIVDARVFSLGAPPGTPERTLEHEALHIAIGQRGETLHDLRDRSDDPASAYGITLEVAGTACEEFRVERTLWGIHTAPSPTSQLADFESTLRRFDGIVSSASQRYQQDHDVERIMGAVGAAFNAIATATGYVAAEIDATDETRLPQVEIDLARRLLGGVWVDLVRALRELPPADVEASRADLDTQAHEVARCVEAWLEHIGFAWENTDDGGLFFHVLKAQQWHHHALNA